MSLLVIVRSRIMLTGAIAAAALLSIARARPAQIVAPPMTVMTWNIYSGGDFADVLNGGSLSNAMGDLFESVQATDFPARAEAITREIEDNHPHLIALQEVATWNADPFFGGSGTTIDFLAILQNHLLAHGLHYDVVGTLTALDFEAPGIVDGDPMNIRWTERIVVLALHSANLHISNVHAHHYQHTYSINVPVVGDIEFERGWIQMNVDFHGRNFRFVNTHLEALSSAVRAAQAIELVQHAGATDLPVVMVGDFNAVAGQGPYNTIANAGFLDSWAQQHPINSGPTCCQDGDLLNGPSALDHRLDLIWYRMAGDFDMLSSRRVGQQQSDRTPDGLWPSDHAGVVVRLLLH